MPEETPDPERPVENEAVQGAFQQAQQFHQMMDQAKEWSRETVTNLRVEAALEDDAETTEEIEQVASMVETVGKRIERGDANLARSIQP